MHCNEIREAKEILADHRVGVPTFHHGYGVAFGAKHGEAALGGAHPSPTPKFQGSRPQADTVSRFANGVVRPACGGTREPRKSHSFTSDHWFPIAFRGADMPASRVRVK